MSLFWRTFFLLAILLAGGVFAWVQTLRALDFEPRAVQAAQQTAGLVNLARASLKHTDGINRVALVRAHLDLSRRNMAMYAAPEGMARRVAWWSPPARRTNC